MNAGEICKGDVATVREFDELSSAARLMREKHVGYLVVVEPNPANSMLRPIGVLTDRDIVVSVVAQDTDPRSLKVGDIMTRQPVVASEESSIALALQDMRRIGVRRLPIVDSSGQLVGVLSLDDVLDALASELNDAAGSIRKELRTESALRP